MLMFEILYSNFYSAFDKFVKFFTLFNSRYLIIIKLFSNLKFKNLPFKARVVDGEGDIILSNVESEVYS
jgi:hypothetical protein